MHYPVLADAMRKDKGDDTTMGKTLDLVRKISRAEGEATGEARGEDRFAALLTKLKSMGRNDDVDRVITDKTYRKELMKELAIQ